MGGPFVSYAQNAEDVVLARGLKPDGRAGFWIDVGANHPWSDSVTAAFSQRGWTGINIEPLPPMHAALVEARPHDVNLPIALGDRPGRSTLYLGPGAFQGNATLDRSQADGWRAAGIDTTEIEIEVSTLAAVVAAHVTGPVEFLKVDVEGAERQVLDGADWATFRPRVVLVEATEPNTTVPSHGSWEPILTDAGYHFVLFDGLNRFYVRDDEAELAEALSVPANPLDDYLDHRLVGALDERDVSRAQQAEAQVQLTELRAELEDLQARQMAVQAERDAIVATRTWRYTEPGRRLYRRLRHR